MPDTLMELQEKPARRSGHRPFEISVHHSSYNDPLQLVLSRLERVKRCRNGYVASCPVPDHGKGRGDGNPSLSIGIGGEGQVLVRCHGGCSLDAILAALGLTHTDLYPRKDSLHVHHKERERVTYDSIESAILALLRDPKLHGGKVTHQYQYNTGDGTVSLVVLRFDFDDGREKTFRPIHPVGKRWAIGDPPGRLPLYRLPEILTADAVYVCEGEKAVEAARSIGLCASTSAHGAQSPQNTDWTPLAGKTVAILPDNDKPGRKFARTVAKMLLRLGCQVKIVELPGLPEGGDIADFIEARDSRDSDDLRRMVEFVAADTPHFTESAAEPHAALDWQPFPLHVLPEPVRSYISESANAIGCDTSFVALPVLSVLAAAIGTTRRIKLKRRWCEYCILWTLILGRSGTLRSPAFDQAMTFVHRRQRDAMRAYQKAMEQYELNAARYEDDIREWRAKGRKQGEPKPQPPREPTCEQVYVEDVTMEALAPILLHHQRGLLVARDELSGHFGSFNQYKRAKGSDEAHWLNMFGGRPLKVNRKTGDLTTIYVPVAAVSITGGIQPGVLRRVLRPEYFESGMAARFLLAMPPIKPRRWSDKDVDPAVEDAMEEAYGKLAALEWVDRDGEPVPIDLALTLEAKAMFVRFVNEHGLEQFELDDDLASAWSKLECYAPRLTLLIHMVRWAAGDPTLKDANVIDAESLSAAITVTRWCAREARRVYAMLAQSEQEREEERIMSVIQRNGGRITPRELVQKVWSIKTVAAAESCLHGLQESGLGRSHYPKPGSKGGKPTRVFLLHEGAGTKETPADAQGSEGSVDVDAIDDPQMLDSEPGEGGVS